ncbi:MAG: hypothetical protein ACNI3A_15900 [Desulfovibrio sp.]|uniref:hypothetical protein n=1 Tax=Desulfovibrio sp. 7SRBS1 TaxID=3378064 RepID=UPI003B3D844A
MSDMPNNTVKVYIWDSGKSGQLTGSHFQQAKKDPETGHCALAVQDNQGQFKYLSWYPTRGVFWPSRARMPPGYGRHRSVIPVGGGHRLLSDKVLNAGVPAPGTPLAAMPTESANRKYRFYEAFNCNFIVNFIVNLELGLARTSGLVGAMMYNLLLQNCSATVAHALRTGGADNWTPWPAHIVWSPGWVRTYCDALYDAINALAHGNIYAIRGVNL